MVEVLFREVYRDHAFNTAIAAGILETITDSIGDRRQYGPFNSLVVKNRDTVDIQVQLDGLTGPGKVFEVATGDTLILNEKDEAFSFVVQKNLHATTAEVADAIIFRWARLEPVALLPRQVA